LVNWTLVLSTVALLGAPTLAASAQSESGATGRHVVESTAKPTRAVESSHAAPSAQQTAAQVRERVAGRYAQSLNDTLGGVEAFTYELDDAGEGELAGGVAPRGAAALTSSGRPESPERYQVNLVTGTGVLERVQVQETAAEGPRPLLVVFHKFGVSELDAPVNTSYFEEARRRKWHVVAPRSWGGIHFSSEKSQIHTRRVLDWATANLSVDPSRIYAVGFSMGGGAALNYAARHLDPAEPRFAAVASLSALLSHEHAYANEIQPTRDAYDDIFGDGSLDSADAWLMQRSSLFSFDALTQQVIPGTDLARNLAHTNVYLFGASGDIPYLIPQHSVMVSELAGLSFVTGTHQSQVVNFGGHSWDLVDERLVCDWLRQFQLTTPTSGDTLADHDGAYFHFDVRQDTAGAFSPFTWQIDALNNTVSISNTENVQSLTLHTSAAGLSNTTSLFVSVSAADGLADKVVLRDWPTPPTRVLRDTLVVANWSHDAQTGELTFTETDAAPHLWEVQP